ncbi:MAG: 4Fe-4S binding protein [Peptococcales bacterium]|jgi:MinD superfamily P-loop ATPase
MLKEIVVISGKGGTGKTSLVAALATLLESKVMADCDVDAADLHLVLNPTILEEHEFWSGKTAFINNDKCSVCGKCQELCRFEAIDLVEKGHNSLGDTTSKSEKSPQLILDNIACEGCGVCAYFCPNKAITLEDNLSGHWFISKTEYGPLVHARLGIAEENSGKLVTLVKSEARKIAAQENKNYLLIDGSPGIGCPVIASLSGCDLLLIVTEPTLSGIHDLERITTLAQHFNIPQAVCINKSDINPEMSNEILSFCQRKNISVLGIIPYDRSVTQAQIHGQSTIEYAPDSPATQEFTAIKNKLINLIS